MSNLNPSEVLCPRWLSPDHADRSIGDLYYAMQHRLFDFQTHGVPPSMYGELVALVARVLAEPASLRARYIWKTLIRRNDHRSNDLNFITNTQQKAYNTLEVLYERVANKPWVRHNSTYYSIMETIHRTLRYIHGFEDSLPQVMLSVTCDMTITRDKDEFTKTVDDFLAEFITGERQVDGAVLSTQTELLEDGRGFTTTLELMPTVTKDDKLGQFYVDLGRNSEDDERVYVNVWITPQEQQVEKSMQQYIGINEVKAVAEERDGKPGFAFERADGYRSWASAEAFRSYCPVINMSFAMAMFYVAQGKRVARSGWNGKNMWIRQLQPNNNNQFDFIEKSGAEGTLYSMIMLKGAGNELVPWQPSQLDMGGNDWHLFIEDMNGLVPHEVYTVKNASAGSWDVYIPDYDSLMVTIFDLNDINVAVTAQINSNLHNLVYVLRTPKSRELLGVMDGGWTTRTKDFRAGDGWHTVMVDVDFIRTHHAQQG